MWWHDWKAQNLPKHSFKLTFTLVLAILYYDFIWMDCIHCWYCYCSGKIVPVNSQYSFIIQYLLTLTCNDSIRWWRLCDTVESSGKKLLSGAWVKIVSWGITLLHTFDWLQFFTVWLLLFNEPHISSVITFNGFHM